MVISAFFSFSLVKGRGKGAKGRGLVHVLMVMFGDWSFVYLSMAFGSSPPGAAGWYITLVLENVL